MLSFEELDAKIKELREWKIIRKQAEETVEGLEDEIKAEMNARNMNAMTGTDWSTSYKEVTTTRLDSKALKAEHPDLYAKYSVKSTTRRFVLA